MLPLEQHGLLKELPQEQKDSNQKEIVVYPKGRARGAADLSRSATCCSATPTGCESG